MKINKIITLLTAGVLAVSSTATIATTKTQNVVKADTFTYYMRLSRNSYVYNHKGHIVRKHGKKVLLKKVTVKQYYHNKYVGKYFAHRYFTQIGKNSYVLTDNVLPFEKDNRTGKIRD